MNNTDSTQRTHACVKSRRKRRSLLIFLLVSTNAGLFVKASPLAARFNARDCTFYDGRDYESTLLTVEEKNLKQDAGEGAEDKDTRREEGNKGKLLR